MDGVRRSALAANRLSLPCSAGASFPPGLKAGVSTKEGPDDHAAEVNDLLAALLLIPLALAAVAYGFQTLRRPSA
ncbi:hypothetical protein [Streptomyces sp. NPDC005322]|uniref:hypothetical protein n=1 Tax=Streptomyces sp. NPDC005322 TaxID=3157032 RepID=UPI00339E7E8D